MVLQLPLPSPILVASPLAEARGVFGFCAGVTGDGAAVMVSKLLGYLRWWTVVGW